MLAYQATGKKPESRSLMVAFQRASCLPERVLRPQSAPNVILPGADEKNTPMAVGTHHDAREIRQDRDDGSRPEREARCRFVFPGSGRRAGDRRQTARRLCFLAFGF